jgi:hypothetical protein
MYTPYTETYNLIRERAQREVQHWADGLVGYKVRICRGTGSILANDVVTKVEAQGLDVRFSFEGGMWCTLPSGNDYTVEIV